MLFNSKAIVLVHYRIGSLEKLGASPPVDAVVHYRIGSLEIPIFGMMVHLLVHYRIGSLEKLLNLSDDFKNL